MRQLSGRQSEQRQPRRRAGRRGRERRARPPRVRAQLRRQAFPHPHLRVQGVQDSGDCQGSGCRDLGFRVQGSSVGRGCCILRGFLLTHAFALRVEG